MFREEYSRVMWSELEELVRVHADTSPNHQTVLDILHGCRPASASDDAPSISTVRKRRGTTDSRTDASRTSTPSSEM